MIVDDPDVSVSHHRRLSAPTREMAKGLRLAVRLLRPASCDAPD